MNPSSCPECGAPVAGGRAGCQKLFDEVLAREFGDFRYGRLHRLTVDAYALQHPAEYMRSAKSYAAHLTGMCAAMDLDDARSVNEAVQRWLNGPTTIERRSEPPGTKRGELTIAHVHAAADADEHLARVREWARSAWNAWRDYHPIARQWIARAGAGAARK
jgi:Family of unknown function (DUF5946)